MSRFSRQRERSFDRHAAPVGRRAGLGHVAQSGVVFDGRVAHPRVSQVTVPHAAVDVSARNTAEPVDLVLQTRLPRFGVGRPIDVFAGQRQICVERKWNGDFRRERRGREYGFCFSIFANSWTPWSRNGRRPTKRTANWTTWPINWRIVCGRPRDPCKSRGTPGTTNGPRARCSITKTRWRSNGTRCRSNWMTMMIPVRVGRIQTKLRPGTVFQVRAGYDGPSENLLGPGKLRAGRNHILQVRGILQRERHVAFARGPRAVHAREIQRSDRVLRTDREKELRRRMGSRTRRSSSC